MLKILGLVPDYLRWYDLSNLTLNVAFNEVSVFNINVLFNVNFTFYINFAFNINVAFH